MIRAMKREFGTGVAFWFVVSIPLILVVRAWLRRGGPAASPEREETPAGFDLPPGEDWVSVGAFPMNLRSIQPFGAQFLGPSFGHNARYLAFEALTRFLVEEGVPFHVAATRGSILGAQEVFVPRESADRVRGFLGRKRA